MPEREIPFEGVLNFRDLGGYATADGRTVRWRRLFRSMTPEWMTEADLERARRDLGINLVVDLRGETDPLGGATRSSGELASNGVRRVPIDFICGMREERLPRPEGDVPETFFPWLLKCVGPEIVQSIEALATDDAVALFHCHTGKDRTGLLAALILGLLGVDEEDIVADYMMSAPHFLPMLEYLEAKGQPVSPQRLWIAREAPSEAGLRATLAMLRDEYGGPREFLRACGASDDLLDAFVEQMLE